jgi:hypothetical protein
MVGRWLGAALVVVALAIAGCGGGDDGGGSTSTAAFKGGTMKIQGPWAGQLTQAGLPPFNVAVLIVGGRGKVAYTGIDCAGDWQLTDGGDPGPTYVFRETINRGAGAACKGSGTVHLEEFAPKRLRYRFEGGGVTSGGILRPAPTPAWAAIFREAGVKVGAGTSVRCPKGTVACTAAATGNPPGQMPK